jgi:hypothetical protein
VCACRIGSFETANVAVEASKWSVSAGVGRASVSAPMLVELVFVWKMPKRRLDVCRALEKVGRECSKKCGSVDLS